MHTKIYVAEMKITQKMLTLAVCTELIFFYSILFYSFYSILFHPILLCSIL